MSDFVLSTRRRRLWPVFIMPILVLVAAAAWSAFWFYAASQVDQTVDAWRAREAGSGRGYDRANRSGEGLPARAQGGPADPPVALGPQNAGAGPPQTPDPAALPEDRHGVTGQ